MAIALESGASVEEIQAYASKLEISQGGSDEAAAGSEKKPPGHKSESAEKKPRYDRQSNEANHYKQLLFEIIGKDVCVLTEKKIERETPVIENSGECPGLGCDPVKYMGRSNCGMPTLPRNYK